MNDVFQFTVKTAVKAGTLLKDYFDQAGIHASQKPDHTVVTEADLAADQLITQLIHSQFPTDSIISEESSYEIMNIDAPVWIIDPLDGTTNFSLGLPIWGVSIGRILDGAPQIGVLYFPMINELYTVQRGGGAFLNDEQIFVKTPDPSQPMSFFACCSRTFRYYNISVPYKTRIMGSGSYNFCLVARGAALLGFDAAAKIWDLGACWLLVEEAGGLITAFEGPSPFPIQKSMDFEKINYPTLAAASADVFSMGQKKIQRKT